MRELPNLELHVAHGCNLRCESCSHYSNQGHSGVLALEDAEHWMAAWDSRLDPEVFSLLGGEPTIHPQLPEFVTLSRRHWPRAQILIVTNGFFLRDHPTLPRVLRSDPNASLELSIHHHSAEYQRKLDPILTLLGEWVREYRIQARIRLSFRNWTRRYKGIGATMEPFEDGQPRRSWERCPAKHCPQLFEGRIWKCAPLAYLKLQEARYGLSENWRPYLGYQPLSPDVSDDRLVEFLDREEEPYCAMCPAEPESFRLQVPFPRPESTRGL